MSVKQISRSTGRSTTGAAAYRAAERIVDVRTGEIHDYTRKGGVDAAHLSLPGGSTENRAAFWNRLEQHHKRADAVLARE
ncbi:MobA/MobL family protein, partial [Robbsia sp. Bb-Pol-6]